MNVAWTRTAQGHLRAIYDYIAADSQRHALRVVDSITRRTETLKTNPRLGAEVPEYGEETIRELLFRSYRIIYRLLPDRIDVLAVIHGARPLPDDPS
jgi:plasmid stabilization system protein ParE